MRPEAKARVEGSRGGGPIARAAAAGYGPVQRGDAGHREDQMPGLGEPWNLPWVGRKPPAGKDVWNVGSLRDGWLIREHRIQRSQAFDPSRVYTMPCECAQLDGARWTAVFYSDGSQELVVRIHGGILGCGAEESRGPATASSR